MEDNKKYNDPLPEEEPGKQKEDETSPSDAPAPKEDSLDSQWAEVLGLEFDEERVEQNRQKQQNPPVPPVPPRMPSGMPVPPQPDAYINPSFVQPGQMHQQPQTPQFDPSEKMPGTYLVWSILALVLCCFIPAIVAVIYSSSVSTRFYAHDYEGARRASENAQIWIIVSIVLGVISNAFYLPLLFI